MVLSDEIYSRLLFEGEHFSIMSVPGMQERTILLDGFSKTYAMTGWRMGYGVMRADLAAQHDAADDQLELLHRQLYADCRDRGHPGRSKHRWTMMRDEFQRRRDVFVAGLNKIKGFSCRMPKGAFYVFPNITRRPDGSRRIWPTRCWSRQELRRSRARHSASSAKATCASAWPIRWRICRRRSTASTSGRRRTCDASSDLLNDLPNPRRGSAGVRSLP